MKKKLVVLLSGLLSLSIVQFTDPYIVNAAENNSNKNIIRIQGSNRLKTSIAIADQLGASKFDNIVLAYAYDFPDALSGSTLAKKLNAPLLLIGKLEDSSDIIEYVSQHLSEKGNIYLLGGEGVIAKNIEDTFLQKGFNTKRLSGNNRIETNNAIIEDMNVPQGTSVFIASSEGFADALSASGVAASKGFPILLTGKDSLNPLMKTQLTKIMPEKIYIVGGTGVISNNIQEEVRKLVPTAEIERLSGNDRYETSMKVYKTFNTRNNNVVLASGRDFPDALSGSLFAVKNNSSIVLADEADFDTQRYTFDQYGVENYYVLGGTGALSEAIEDSIHFDKNKEMVAVDALLHSAINSFNEGRIDEYMSYFDNSLEGYDETKDILREMLDFYAENNLIVSVNIDSLDVTSVNYREATVRTFETTHIRVRQTDIMQSASGRSYYKLRKIHGQWKIYDSESSLNESQNEEG